MIMEFMVFITNKFPADGDKDLLQKLIKGESERASELASDGVIKKIWRRPGQKSNVGIWVADNATDLHSAISSLPFFQWLEVEIWPLADHPNDPKKYGDLK
jgi:muconolactone D-isomerase